MSLKVIKFGAVWCGPCRALQSIWDEIVDGNPGIEFESIDVDKEPKMAQKYKISSVPTILFLKDGVLWDKMVGLHKKADIEDKIMKLGA